ncbi:UNVERIFIED_CONTAM: hypothetical protein FKN15_002997 [Acipenser sinensis]
MYLVVAVSVYQQWFKCSSNCFSVAAIVSIHQQSGDRFLTVEDKKVCANSKDAWVKSTMRRLSYRLKQLSKKRPDENGDGKKAIPDHFTAIVTPAAP